MIMFRLNQWVRIRDHEDEDLKNQKGMVIRVDDDGTAKIRLNKTPHVVVSGVDPSQCEAV